MRIEIVLRQARSGLMLICTVTSFFAVSLPAMGSEKDCRELNKKVLQLAGKVEELQAEAARPSSMASKEKQRQLGKQNLAVARSLEDLMPQIEKSNCKQFDWWGRKNGEVAGKGKTTWCRFEKRTLDEPSRLSLEDDVPHCECSGMDIFKVKTEEEENYEVKETKDSAGKVIRFDIAHPGNDTLVTYFRNADDCKKIEAPFLERMNQLKKEKPSKATTDKSAYE